MKDELSNTMKEMLIDHLSNDDFVAGITKKIVTAMNEAVENMTFSPKISLKINVGFFD